MSHWLKLAVLTRAGAAAAVASAASVVHLLCLRGRELLYHYCARTGVGHRRLGKLIIAASEAKSSPTHWELYTYSGAGDLSLHSPGQSPAEVRSGVPVCDGKWHHVAAAIGVFDVPAAVLWEALSLSLALLSLSAVAAAAVFALRL